MNKNTRQISLLKECIRESVISYICEARGIQSRKVYDAFKQYGGWGKNDIEHSVIDIHNLTDNDVIGIMDNREIASIQSGKDTGGYRWSENYGLDKWAKQQGYDVQNGDRVCAINLGDGQHSLIAISRNAMLAPGRNDGWKNYHDKRAQRSYNRNGDGNKNYMWKNREASDAFHNPYFKDWPQEDRQWKMNQARQFSKRQR